MQDTAYEEEPSTIDANTTVYTGRICPRIVLVLDCVWPHEYSAASQTYVNLQQHLIKVKRMSDRVALPIFRDIVANVEYLHQRNIIHRDLKLGNIQLNRHTNRTVITNFCLSKLLQGNEDPMHDQRGSPAYISPEVLTGRPYAGKPIDVWSLGVMLYMMVVGHLPFYENSPALLFKKIKAADYTFPTSPALSYDTTQLIRGMLQLSPQQRMTAEAVRQRVDVILESRRRNKSGEQTVPEFVPPPPVPLIAGAAGAESSSSSAVGSASKSAKPWTEGSLTMLPGSWLFRRGEQVVPDVDANKNAAGTSTSARVRSRDRKPFIRPSADIFGSHMTPLPMPSASTTTAAATMVLAAQPPTGNSIVPETSTPRQRSTHVLANIESVIERSRMRLISIERYIADADQNNATVTGRRIDVRQNPNYSALQLRHTVMDNNDSVNGRSRIVNRGISETAVLPGRVASNATGLAAPRVAVEPLAADADRDEAMRRLNHLVQSRRSNQRSMAASAQSPLTVVYNGLLVNTTQTVAPPDTANGASSSHSSASTANPNPVPVLLSTVGGPQTPRREPYFYPLDNFQPTAMHRFSVQRTMAAPAEPAPLSPPSLIPNMNVGASASQDICAAVRQLFQAVNETFIRGQLPMPLPDAQLLPFDGRVTAEFCAAVAGWLLSEYADNRLVAAVFGGNANADAVANVANVCVFLKSCGVVAHRQDADGAYRLRRGQPMEVRIFMTLLLQATGYSVSMFV